MGMTSPRKSANTDLNARMVSAVMINYFLTSQQYLLDTRCLVERPGVGRSFEDFMLRYQPVKAGLEPQLADPRC